MRSFRPPEMSSVLRRSNSSNAARSLDVSRSAMTRRQDIKRYTGVVQAIQGGCGEIVGVIYKRNNSVECSLLCLDAAE
jgi:hypothetical protein